MSIAQHVLASLTSQVLSKAICHIAYSTSSPATHAALKVRDLVQDLAATPMDSQDRFEARRLLPGMAARLRVVGQAAPILAALSQGPRLQQGGDRLGALWWRRGARAVTDEVYFAIGSVRCLPDPAALIALQAASACTASQTWASLG